MTGRTTTLVATVIVQFVRPNPRGAVIDALTRGGWEESLREACSSELAPQLGQPEADDGGWTSFEIQWRI